MSPAKVQKEHPDKACVGVPRYPAVQHCEALLFIMHRSLYKSSSSRALNSDPLGVKDVSVWGCVLRLLFASPPFPSRSFRGTLQKHHCCILLFSDCVFISSALENKLFMEH